MSGQAFEKKSITVGYIDEKVVVDGKLDESFWAEQSVASGFYQYFPTDSLPAIKDTEIRLVSNGKTLFVGIKCYARGNDWMVTSLRRDFRAGGNDNITLIFDTFNDKTNAFFFGINPEGVNREGVITNGGNDREDFSESWDNKWRGESFQYADFYTSELAIPLSSIRYKEGSDTWGFMAYRFDVQENENTVWNRIPRNQILFNLAFTGEMKWEKAPEKQGANLAFIPFISSGFAKNYDPNEPLDKDFAVGGDAKVAITSGLNLDLTANPDFSQVEVDRQITNVDRFEIFFPERRQFFLENADLFGGFGQGSINPFFSRRIGVGIDTTTGTNIQNKILGGMRLSGKIGKDTRVGLLNMHTAEDMSRGLPSSNYSVGVIQQKILKRSNIGGILVNRQVFGDNLSSLDINRYNRVAGIDFNFASADNSWTGKLFGHGSFTDGQSKMGVAHGASLEYSQRSWGFQWSQQHVSADYNAETGFVRRKDYWRFNPGAELRYYPQNDFINDYTIGIEGELITRPGLGRTDHEYSLDFRGQFANTSNFFIGFQHEYILLTDDFDPTGTDSEPLLAGTAYNFFNIRGSFSTDNRKKFTASFRPFLGGYFNGFRTGINSSLTWRYPPFGSIAMDFSFNNFDMPHLVGDRQTYLIGPRIDYTFSKSIFFTTFIQYNSQSANTNINARLQWRFAPVSDFYLVFTDNYFTGNLDDPSDRFAVNIKNRAVVAKLTYWFNI